ncbi:hypothetical protein [Streptomyces lydicus]|uniref:hypothetical protein n=1 Tax=Streptomyces lydicus TaxID=47763 RepID=UPI00287093C6|nr:hypothetical protein [Streptomyces lydicus]
MDTERLRLTTQPAAGPAPIDGETISETIRGAHRPALTAMAEAMREARGYREVLCLVHNWGRLASDDTHRLMLQQRIIQVGGYTMTTFGESDRHTLRAVPVGRQS